MAVDTEFMRTDTFYPRLGLLQIADAEKQYLIDPIAISDLEILKATFTARTPLKVLHSCSEDLEVFKCVWGQVPGSLFDTQIAAAFLGFGLQLSYQNLLKQVLDVEIEKGETRSDWCQRPLTEKQRLYAAHDVVYLEALYDYLVEKLKTQHRLSWVEEDCNALLTAANLEPAPEAYFLKFRNAWKFDRERQQLLQALSTWRELQARQRNKPRGFIIKDAEMLAMLQARHLPNTQQQLLDLGLHPRTVRKEGDELLAIISSPLNSDDFTNMLKPPLPISAKPLLTALKKLANEKAQSLEVPIEILANKKTIEAYVMSCVEKLPDEVRLASTWRDEILSHGWLQLVHEHRNLIDELKKYFNI